MYSPAIQPELTHRIYNLSKKRKRPMTKIVNEIIRTYFDDKKSKNHNHDSIADYEPEYYSDLIKVKCSKCLKEMTVDPGAESAYCEHCEIEVFLIPA